LITHPISVGKRELVKLNKKERFIIYRKSRWRQTY